VPGGQNPASKLLAKISKLETEIRALEAQTESYTTEGDGLERKLTELTIHASLSAKQRRELGKRENGQIAQALKLLASQMEMLEEEISFLRGKNERMQQEISTLVEEHRARKAGLAQKLEEEQAGAQAHAAEAEKLEKELEAASAELASMKEALDAKNGEKEQLQAALESLGDLCRRCREPAPPAAPLLQSLLEEVNELRNEAVKILVRGYENPVRFAEGDAREEYLRTLARLARKKAQVAQVRAGIGAAASAGVPGVSAAPGAE